MSVAFGFRQRHSRRDLLQRFDDVIELERLDDALDQFHYPKEYTRGVQRDVRRLLT